MSAFDYSQISPGVRDLVRELREVHGLETTDSGDGSNYAAGMQGAQPERHVVGRVPEQACDLVSFAHNLRNLYPGSRVEVSYSPGEAAIWVLLPDGYSDETLAELGVSREPVERCGDKFDGDTCALPAGHTDHRSVSGRTWRMAGTFEMGRSAEELNAKAAIAGLREQLAVAEEAVDWIAGYPTSDPPTERARFALAALARLRSAPEATTGDRLYYMEDTRTTVGNCIVWWAKDHKGYTCHLDKAHVFTEDEAARIAANRSTDVPWPKGVVDAAASLMVDHQLLPEHEQLGPDAMPRRKAKR